MLKKIIWFSVIGLSFNGFTGWSDEAALDNPIAESTQNEDTKEFSGSVVHLDRKVAYFQISLPENPTTGFKCYLSKYDPQSLEPISSTYTPKKLPIGNDQAQVNSIVGAGGVRTFVFQVKPVFHNAPQKTKLEFRYDRPWAAGDKGNKKEILVYSSG